MFVRMYANQAQLGRIKQENESWRECLICKKTKADGLSYECTSIKVHGMLTLESVYRNLNLTLF